VMIGIAALMTVGVYGLVYIGSVSDHDARPLQAPAS
jgi:hypothetical protein